MEDKRLAFVFKKTDDLSMWFGHNIYWRFSIIENSQAFLFCFSCHKQAEGKHLTKDIRTEKNIKKKKKIFFKNGKYLRYDKIAL